MTCRAAFTLVFALAGCEAKLGTGGGVADALGVEDAPALTDAQMTDTSVDARPCTGGNAAAVAPDGSCLVHVTTPVTYAAAKSACAAMNAHLAYLKTAQLDTFAQTFIGAVDTWIGGTDLATEMTFLWDDGTAFVFTAWASGEPNNAGNEFQEDCAIIAGSRAGKLWDDRPCDATEVPTSGTFAYLCQY